MKKHSIGTRIICAILVISFISSQVFASEIPTNTLAASLISDDINPGRANSVQNDVASDVKAGAIGNGQPLIDLLSGKLPPKIELDPQKTADIREKIRRAIRVALKLYNERRNDIADGSLRDLAHKAFGNTINFHAYLSKELYPFNSIREPSKSLGELSEDYLVGFALDEFRMNEKAALAIDFIDWLYARYKDKPEIADLRLAQYIFHERTPEKTVVNGNFIDRSDHRMIYNRIQGAIFGEDEVLALKQDLRDFIDRKPPVLSDGAGAFKALDVVSLFKITEDLRGAVEIILSDPDMQKFNPVVKGLDEGNGEHVVITYSHPNKPSYSRGFELRRNHDSLPINMSIARDDGRGFSRNDAAIRNISASGFEDRVRNILAEERAKPYWKEWLAAADTNAAAPEAPDSSSGDKLAEYLKSVAGGDIVAIDDSSLENIADVLENGDVASINFKSLESKPDRYEVVSHILFGICMYIEQKFPSSAYVGDLNILGTEILKNAFVHGNKLNFNLPIYIHIRRDGDLNILEIIDCAAQEKTGEKEMRDAEAADLYGMGVGENRWLSKAPYKRQAIKDEAGNTIGTIASLVLNTIRWGNPLANYPDAIVAQTQPQQPVLPEAPAEVARARVPKNIDEVMEIVRSMAQNARAFAFDVDGTLMDLYEEPVTEVVPLLVELLKMKKHVAIISGRRASSMYDGIIKHIREYPGVTEEDLKYLFVAINNGGCGYLNAEFPSGKALYETKLDPSIIEQLKALFERNGWSGNPVYDIGINESKVNVKTQGGNKDPERLGPVYEIVKAYVESHKLPVIVTFGGNSVEVNPESVNKGLAIGHLKSLFGLTDDEIVRIGDQGQPGGNDAAMMNAPSSFTVEQYNPDDPNQIAVAPALGVKGKRATITLVNMFIEEIRNIAQKSAALESQADAGNALLLKAIEQSRVFAFDIGGTLAEEKVDTPSDEMIKALAGLLNNGRSVVIISAKQEKVFRVWIEEKLMPLVEIDKRELFMVYGDRVTKTYRADRDGHIFKISVIPFPYPEKMDEMVKVADITTSAFVKEVLEESDLADDTAALLKEKPFKVKAGDTFIQISAGEDLPKSGDNVRKRLLETLVKAFKEAGLLLPDIEISLPGKKGAMILNKMANKPGAISDLMAMLGVTPEQVTYFADQFAGKSTADLSVANTGVNCVNVGTDENMDLRNVLNLGKGPDGTRQMAGQIILAAYSATPFAPEAPAKSSSVVRPSSLVAREKGYKDTNHERLTTNDGIAADLPLRAAAFKATLMRILAENKDQLFFIGVEDDIGEGSNQKAQIMPVYKAVSEIEALKDADGKKLFPNLMVNRGSAASLVSAVTKLQGEGKLTFDHAFIGARKLSVEGNAFNAIQGEAKAWISAIDDSREGDYLPVFEAITLNMLAYANADLAAIKSFYDAISDAPIDLAALQEMMKNRIVYILPKMTRFSGKELRDLYESVRQVYMSA